MNQAPSFLRPVSNKQESQTPSFLRPISKDTKSKEQNFPFEGENDLERETERNIAQQTSRMGEAILGAPGDVWSFAKSLFGFDPETNLPTSKSLKQSSERLSGGYTKPQSEFEEKIGKVQQDIAGFLIPGSKQYSMFRNIGIPVVANLAKEGIKKLGSDVVGESAKIGLMIGLDLLSQRQGGAKKHISGIFNQMHERIQKGRSVNVKPLESALEQLIKEQSKGGSRPSTIKSLQKANEIKNQIKNGKIDLEYLAEARPVINELIEDLGGFEYLFKPKQKEKVIKNLQKVKGASINAFEDYAKQFDPELYKLSQSANEAWAVYEKSNKIGQFLTKHFGKKALSGSVKAVLGLGSSALAKAAVGAPGTALIGIPAATAYQGIKVLNRVKNSPTLRKYYSSILKASMKGNVGQATRSINALNKELEEDDEE